VPVFVIPPWVPSYLGITTAPAATSDNSVLHSDRSVSDWLTTLAQPQILLMPTRSWYFTMSYLALLLGTYEFLN
jgi:hypothetical protein